MTADSIAQLLREAAEVVERCGYSILASDLEQEAASLEAQEPVATVMRHEYTDGSQPENGFSNADWARLESLEPGTKLYRHPPTSAVPDGWKLAPVRPTYEMLQTATGVHPRMRYVNRDNAKIWDAAYDTYVSMLAAAPQQGGGEDG